MILILQRLIAVFGVSVHDYALSPDLNTSKRIRLLALSSSEHNPRKSQRAARAGIVRFPLAILVDHLKLMQRGREAELK